VNVNYALKSQFILIYFKTLKLIRKMLFEIQWMEPLNNLPNVIQVQKFESDYN